MNGREIVKKIELELFNRGITKGEFYEDCGLNSTTLSNWRNGTFTPSRSKLHIIEDYLGIKLIDDEDSKPMLLDQETMDLLNSMRERPELKMLLKSASDVPPSSVYSILAKLELEKERNAE